MPEERMRLVSPDRLVMLMERTGDGSSITVRELADAVGVHHSQIGHLCTGRSATALRAIALAIAKRIGVDELVLWAPTGRSVSATEEPVTELVAV